MPEDKEILHKYRHYKSKEVLLQEELWVGQGEELMTAQGTGKVP